LAEYLDLPQITYVSKIDIDGRTVTAHRRYEDGFFIVDARLPVLLTVIKELNIARLPSIKGIRAAFSHPILQWTTDDLVIDRKAIGLEGSPTKVLRSFVPQHNSQVEFLNGSPREAAGVLIQKLKQQHVVSA
jgi:electron transfer flavoprotein beta subunit